MAGAAALLAAAAGAALAHETIPRRIYTFWHDRTAVPEFIMACLASLLHYNPGWSVRVLHPDDPDAEPPPLGAAGRLTAQQLSDWRRLVELGKPGGGGVWIDASSIVLKPIESWVNMTSPALQGFTAPFDHSLESWAFAVPRDNALAARWLANFRRALQQGVQPYCDSLPDWLVGTMRHKGFLPYLAVCAAFVEARHQLPEAEVSLFPSQQRRGPTNFISTHNGNPHVSVAYLFNASEADLADVPFLKLRGAERACVRSLDSYRESWLASQLLERLKDSAHLVPLPDAVVSTQEDNSELCSFPNKGYNEAPLSAQVDSSILTRASRRVRATGGEGFSFSHAMLPE